MFRLLLNRFYDAKQNEGKPEKVSIAIYLSYCRMSMESIALLIKVCLYIGKTTVFSI